MESFTTRDVARLLGLTETQVRSQARAGFLTPERGPRNGYRFSFQDLVLLRTARELAQARVPPHRIRRALRDLAQIHIDFAGAEPPGRPAALSRTLRTDAPVCVESRTAWEWFDLGLELEAADPAQSCHAYCQALSIDPELSDAHVNLGRLLQLAGRTREAIEHYGRSLRRDGTDPTGAFNLGTALEELGRWRAALSAYLRALEIDPRFADAHFNLARLYEQLGRRTEAIRHLRAYKQLVD
jgi:tetratricopeptide (TPR) repeat protein